MIEAPPIQSQQIGPIGYHGGLTALLTEAAFAPLAGTGFIQVTGEDRTRWLNGMVTNSIQALKPGDGCYCFFLSAQGRIQGDATAWMLEDSILLGTAKDQIPGLLALLDHFIIMDDVELKPLESGSGLQIVGPRASEILRQIGIQVDAADELHLSHTELQGAPLDLIHAHSPLVPRFELWGTTEGIGRLTDALGQAIPQASEDELEQVRLLEGTPRYGTDIRDRELPQETAQTRALHFAKGCYLGQEIVERIRSRGNVHRTFSGFLLDGPLPVPGTPLFVSDTPDKAVGEITSARAIALPSGSIVAALGYIRREALERALPLTYKGGSMAPSPLPFRLHASQA